LVGGGVTGSDSFGLLVDGQCHVQTGLRSFGWRIYVRAGTEVVSRTDDF
jgi:hypothetical protein